MKRYSKASLTEGLRGFAATMFNYRLSMRTSLGLIIVMMGLLGMALAVVTGEVYRQHAVETHRATLENLVTLKTDDVLKDSANLARELGLGLQHEHNFARLIRSHDYAAIQDRLNSQFHQYFVTAQVVKLVKLAVYDRNLKLLAESTEGELAPGQLPSICPRLMERAKLRSGPQRLKTIWQLCQKDNHPYQAILIPAGGLRLTGYVMVVIDPSHSLKKIENSLGMPLRISLLDNSDRYLSHVWPKNALPHNSLVISHTLRNATSEPILNVDVIADVQPFYEQLATTRIQVMVVAAMITVMAVVVALILFKNSTLIPIQILNRQLRLLRENRAHLGEHVAVGGNVEIRELANDFNKMTSELSGLYKALENIAYIDPITKLANRTRFHDLLQKYTDKNLRANTPFALFIIDVDRFKMVNDSLGHDLGDQLLVQVGSRLEQVLRKSDITTRLDTSTIEFLADDGYAVARLGGDEFSLLLPSVRNADEASIVAQKILTAMEQPFILGENSFNIDISVGIVLAPQHGTDASTLLRRADVAMSEAKNSQSRCHFYDDAYDQHRFFQLTLERQLRDAVENSELEVYFQPQIDFKTGEVWGAEALLRWPHPDQGYIPPDRFVPLAEQSGIIHRMTLWVLQRSLDHCAQWHRAGHAINVSVNLSPRSLHIQNLPAQIQEALDKSGVPAPCLALELTESAVMSDPDQAMNVLCQLDKMGVKLSIDDFGTGYSSMAYLKQLPVDEIKIDRSFVMDMESDNNDAVIVRSIIDLAHNMGLMAVAEGVERREVWDLLVKSGCDVAQGYFMAQPMPEADFRAWLASRDSKIKVSGG
jgi:predicted signal transduction protein with EAL and GGDEF domain